MVLMAEVVFILERVETDNQTRLNALSTPAAIQPTWVISRDVASTTLIKYKYKWKVPKFSLQVQVKYAGMFHSYIE